MNLYVLNYWVPFPRSEYGGLFVVVAKNKKQLKKLLVSYVDGYPEEFEAAITNAEIFAVADTEEPRIVDSFYT
jgi:hypothetical protein